MTGRTLALRASRRHGAELSAPRTSWARRGRTQAAPQGRTGARLQQGPSPTCGPVIHNQKRQHFTYEYQRQRSSAFTFSEEVKEANPKGSERQKESK